MVVTKTPDEAMARPIDQGPNEEPKAEEVQRNKYVVVILKILNFILAQWLIIGFGLACLFGYLWPNVAATDGVIRSEYSILYGSVAIIFLVSGLQLSPQKLRHNLFNWRLHIITQGISFVVIPLIWLAIIWIIIAAGDLRTQALDIPVLLGMLVLSCLPTTIASNVVMTRNAGGDDAAAIIEVVLGNVFGSFLCPMLIYGFIPNRPEFESWRPASLSGLSQMYKDVGMQLGLSVLIPIGVGQTLRMFFEEKVLWCMQKFYLAKISTFFLCTLVWATFSNAFKTGAIYQLPKGSIIFNVLMNVVLYGLFTAICFTMARPPRRLVTAFESPLIEKYLPRAVRRIVAPKQMSREQTIAVCFCGAAKTTSVGIPLVSAMWAQKDDLTRAFVAIPVMLYTMEQVFLAQILVYAFRHYLKRGEAAARKGSLDVERGAGEGVVGVDEVDGTDGTDGTVGESKSSGDRVRMEEKT
ncbi:hypothetical protein VP1G_06447 [Cytospora mali]|uniref:Sodium/bile acid cotransporter 7 n=1 Tax=Cytospora mali TaxID=578113 RepID=A0A194V5P7_CYTMA|nr:hypothetical protein VP1G_06447 [Valsa mali var. pyri (nom. inval.)]